MSQPTLPAEPAYEGVMGDHPPTRIRRHHCDTCGVCGEDDPIITIDVTVEPRNAAVADAIIRVGRRIAGQARPCEWQKPDGDGPVRLTLEQHVLSLVETWRKTAEDSLADAAASDQPSVQSHKRQRATLYKTAARQLEDALALAVPG